MPAPLSLDVNNRHLENYYSIALPALVSIADFSNQFLPLFPPSPLTALLSLVFVYIFSISLSKAPRPARLSSIQIVHQSINTIVSKSRLMH